MQIDRQQGMIMTQTPFRISFFGGGTDFPSYFNEFGGSVIGTAIDKYIYVTMNSLDRFYDKRIRLSYSKLECVDSHEDLKHEIVKCILQNHPYWDDQTFLDIHTYADLPASSGVGSSSSFAVGMLNALYLLNGVYKTPDNIAQEAIFIERDELKESGGWQDQVFAAFGGFNRIRFANNRFIVEPICLASDKKKALEQSCMVFFTGDTRSSAKMQEQVMGVDTQNQTIYLNQIQAIADEAFVLLNNAKTPKELVFEFGKLLDKTWQAKKAISAHISNEKIDLIYDLAIQAGALGGKLCGAGGGGFLLFIVPEEKRVAVATVLSAYKRLNIAFEECGSRVIYSKVFHAVAE
jgi:D-glycero-alpha-D-manno-heptose-7-phosphate kinase